MLARQHGMPSLFCAKQQPFLLLRQFLGTEPGALPAVDLDALERDMRLTPAAGNPFTSHAAPLQEGRRLAAQGQLVEACLATEAAARVSPCTVSCSQQLWGLNCPVYSTAMAWHSTPPATLSQGICLPEGRCF